MLRGQFCRLFNMQSIYFPDYQLVYYNYDLTYCPMKYGYVSSSMGSIYSSNPSHLTGGGLQALQKPQLWTGTELSQHPCELCPCSVRSYLHLTLLFLHSTPTKYLTLGREEFSARNGWNSRSCVSFMAGTKALCPVSLIAVIVLYAGPWRSGSLLTMLRQNSTVVCRVKRVSHDSGSATGPFHGRVRGDGGAGS